MVRHFSLTEGDKLSHLSWVHCLIISCRLELSTMGIFSYVRVSLTKHLLILYFASGRFLVQTVNVAISRGLCLRKITNRPRVRNFNAWVRAFKYFCARTRRTRKILKGSDPKIIFTIQVSASRLGRITIEIIYNHILTISLLNEFTHVVPEDYHFEIDDG
jgi:hypothetical protein